MELLPNKQEIDLEHINRLSNEGDHNWRVLQAAKMYTHAGYWIVPLRKGSKLLPAKEYKVTYGNATNKVATAEKWFGSEGKFRGWNIGIATGKKGGTFAVDVDAHGETNGHETMQDLCQEHGPIPNCPKQKTPTGGVHYLFHWQDGATNSTGKIGKAIDTRGGDENACRGHIVVWPSIVNGKSYQWAEGGNRAVVPKWIADKMGVPWKSQPNKGTGRGNEYVEDDDVEKTLSVEQIKRMLAEISPSSLDYDDWLRIGMAIKSQYPGEDGLQIWDDWSRQGDRYEANECHVRWRGLSELGEVRIGTLFWHAQKNGWQPEKEDLKSNPIKEIVHRMNEEFAVVVIGGKLRILREKKGDYDPVFGHYDMLDRDAFRGMLEPFKVEVLKANGKTAWISEADIWLGDRERRSYPHGMECRPDGKIRTGAYNTWAGFSVKPIKGDCSYILDHVLKIICNGNRDYWEWVLDWCAHAVQTPGELPGSCIVLKGKEGTGKGTLADLMGQYFGPHYRHLIDSAHLLSNFNAHMMDATYVFADEVTYGGEIKVAGKLKGMVTETHLVGERKGIDAVGYKNMISMMIASNEDWIIPVGPHSRRWFVLTVSNEHASDKKYFDQLYTHIDSGGREAFLHYLLTRNITANLRKAPETKSLKEQAVYMAAQFNPVIEWWQRKLMDGALETCDAIYMGGENDEPWPEYVKITELLDEYKAYCKANNIKNVGPDVRFYNKIKEMGLKKVKKTVSGDRRKFHEVPILDQARAIFIANGYSLPEIDDDSDNSE